MSRLVHLLPTCRDMSRLLSDAMDHRLPWHARAKMYAHLRICALCRAYQRQLSLLRAVLRHDPARLSDDATSAHRGLSLEAKERIRRVLDSFRP